MDQNGPAFYLHNFQPTAIDNSVVEAYLCLSHEIAVHHPQMTRAPKSKTLLFSMGSFTNKDNLSAVGFTLTKVSGQMMNKRKQKKLKITGFFKYYTLVGLEAYNL